jgi:hypothetical protein
MLAASTPGWPKVVEIGTADGDARELERLGRLGFVATRVQQPSCREFRPDSVFPLEAAVSVGARLLKAVRWLRRAVAHR